jgi:predicted protein tyrosine phosphatase
MKINVYPQFVFYKNSKFNDSNVEQFDSEYFICLNSTGHIHSTPHFKINHFNVLNTYFDDTDVNRIKVSGNIVYYAWACTREQAITIKDFIKTIPDTANVHIYCAQGKSRSPAVAKFIKEYKSLTDENYPNYNKHVYNLLRTV